MKLGQEEIERLGGSAAAKLVCGCDDLRSVHRDVESECDEEKGNQEHVTMTMAHGKDEKKKQVSERQEEKLSSETHAHRETVQNSSQVSNSRSPRDRLFTDERKFSSSPSCMGHLGCYRIIGIANSD